MSDLTIGASTGIKPYNVDIQEALDLKYLNLVKLEHMF
jgi:hypothetical protein